MLRSNSCLSHLTSQLQTRLGDFWFYSLMIFCACRLSDIISVFVGLWLVPKYVDPKELGAVLPLSSFATMIALPLYIFAMTFMKEVNSLANRQAFGELKTLMRSVFVVLGFFLILAVGVSRLLLPLFLERIRIAEGSLGILIIATGFLGCVAPVYTNALQALKKFKAISLYNFLGGPVRLMAMYLTMPFRALSGYFVGQAAPSLLNISISLIALRKELRVPAKPYWTRPIIKRMTYLFMGITGYQIFGMGVGLVEQTILRQRLSELDSAGYYMATRFSDISGFLACTFLVTLFPFTAERADRGESTRPLVVRASIALILFALLLSVFFYFMGETIFNYLPNGNNYVAYARFIPWLIFINLLVSLQNFHTNTEVSAGRFKFLYWWIPISLLYVVALYFVTGYGYFESYLPIAVKDFIAKINITSIPSLLVWLTMGAALRFICSIFELMNQKKTPL